MFLIEKPGDVVTIGETEYTGEDTILSTNFTVAFQSDGFNTYEFNTGFLLYWSCTQWGEWTPLDGTCSHVMRPLHNGTMTTGLLKYKRSESCSK